MIGDNKKTLFINNAKDNLPVGERRENTRLKREELERVGLPCEELDLRDYFGKKEQLEGRLRDTGLIFAFGGSAFLLRRAMKYSGLDELLAEGLLHDRFVYGGSSAGIMVMTPSLRGTERCDSPDIVPAHYDKEIVWQGLGLINAYFVPHYLSDWFGDRAQALKEYYDEKGFSYHALMDGQVYAIEGAKQGLLS